MANFRDIGLSDNRNNMTSEDVDKLDDFQEAPFRGGTLSLSQDGPLSDVSPLPSAPSVDASPTAQLLQSDSEDHSNANVANENAKNAAHSVPPHRLSSPQPMMLEDIKEFFADGALERASEQCRPVILDILDGKLRGVWLLTEIDHWDNEKERLLFLTDFSLIVLKYDFITLKLLDYKRYPLKQFDSVVIGELKYPETSLMPPRNQQGVRCMWDKDLPLPALKRWNPWSKEIPWITFTSHPLVSHEDGRRSSYDMEDFSQKLTQAIQQLDFSKAPPVDRYTNKSGIEILYKPVMIENYAGLGSVFHNMNKLGFFKARGKVSF